MTFILKWSFCVLLFLSFSVEPLWADGHQRARVTVSLGVRCLRVFHFLIKNTNNVGCGCRVNHTVELVVTRFKRTPFNETVVREGKPVLEFVCIRRTTDNNALSLPGGFVEPGEKLSRAVLNEFCEEALSSRVGENALIEDEMETLFEQSKPLAQGVRHVWQRGLFCFILLKAHCWVQYFADARNTDNAWIEKRIFNLHDPDGRWSGAVQLRVDAGSSSVRWLVAHREVQLFGAHREFLHLAVLKHNAFW
jgi:hypothetical protein